MGTRSEPKGGARKTEFIVDRHRAYPGLDENFAFRERRSCASTLRWCGPRHFKMSPVDLIAHRPFWVFAEKPQLRVFNSRFARCPGHWGEPFRALISFTFRDFRVFRGSFFLIIGVAVGSRAASGMGAYTPETQGGARGNARFSAWVGVERKLAPKGYRHKLRDRPIAGFQTRDRKASRASEGWTVAIGRPENAIRRRFDGRGPACRAPTPPGFSSPHLKKDGHCCFLCPSHRAVCAFGLK